MFRFSTLAPDPIHFLCAPRPWTDFGERRFGVDSRGWFVLTMIHLDSRSISRLWRDKHTSLSHRTLYKDCPVACSLSLQIDQLSKNDALIEFSFPLKILELDQLIESNSLPTPSIMLIINCPSIKESCSRDDFIECESFKIPKEALRAFLLGGLNSKSWNANFRFHQFIPKTSVSSRRIKQKNSATLINPTNHS